MHTMEKAGRNRGAMTALGAVIAALLLPPPPFGGAASAVAVTGPESSSSSCTRSCDNISIPYPFGIEPGCYHGPGFNLTCRNGGSRGHGPPELFLGDGTVQVLEIPVEHSTVRIISTGVQLPRDGSGRSTTTMRWGLGLPKSGPYFLPESANMLKAVGCNIQVSVLGGIGNKSLLSSCTAICPSTSPDSFTKGNHGICTGNGCCQASIVLDYPWPFYTIQMKWLADHDVLLGPPGAVAYIADRSFDFSMDMIRGEGRPKALLATLDWTISNSTCPGNTAPECRSAHSYCQNSFARVHGGYVCRCSEGYEGNPYVPDGCKDIAECKFPNIYACYGDCKNSPGSFICNCNTGYTGNASIPNGCTGLSIGFGVGGTSILFLASGVPFIKRMIKLQKAKKMREKFLDQNHRLLLQ